jgi:hypothetical protein
MSEPTNYESTDAAVKAAIRDRQQLDTGSTNAPPDSPPFLPPPDGPAPGSVAMQARIANVNIAIINRSSVVSDAALIPVVAALQRQVSEHFAPVWGIDAILTFYGRDLEPPQDSWWLLICDDSDQAGALGYHDLTPSRLPLGKVFAQTDQLYGSQWSVTASHELLEMLGDPYINLAAIQSPGNNGAFMSLYAYEVCDACEADQYGYIIDGVLVSDFVYPTWFESEWGQFGTQFDYRNLIQLPFQLLPGGYISVYDVGSGAGWTQLSGPQLAAKYAARANVGSRRERRRILRNRWLPSDPSLSAGPRRGVALVGPPPTSPDLALTAIRQVTLPQRARAALMLRQAGVKRLAVADQIARDRAERFQVFLKQVDNPAEPPASANRAAAAAPGKRTLRILAEGDSWFDYPLPPSYGVIWELQKLLGYPIANMAHAGEEVRQILSLPSRKEIIAKLQNQAVRFDALLLSGGGDDLVGDQLSIYLKMGPAVAGESMLNDAAVSAVLSLLEAEFREIVEIRNKYSEGTALFVNCYDYPLVDGRGVCFQGPWLKPALDYAFDPAGAAKPDQSQEEQTVKELLADFAAMLRKIAGDSQDFIVVPTQGTLDHSTADWANELHPTPSGFAKIARKFFVELSQRFP